MHETLWLELQARRFAIRKRWEALLRAEPIATPLGHPDSLVHLIDSTLDEIFSTLTPTHAPTRAAAPVPAGDSGCPCGRNPLLAYFAAAGQAMREGLILAQAARAPLDPRQRDASLEELNAVLLHISRREIEAFCGVCQFRHLALLAPMETLAIDRR